ncbi:MAG: cytochrome P450 [Benjaminiella poitrasii]|nr:MAG: cytochrome P450 [Benjaminiella poitrasii]
MDYLKPSTSIQFLQPLTHHLNELFRRSTKKELVFLGATTALTIYNLSAYITAKRQKLNLPPTVAFSLPFIGHNLYMMLMPNKFIDWCNNTYGEIYNLVIFGQTVTVASGKCAEEALKAKSEDLSLEHGVLRDVLHLHYVFDDKTMNIGFLANPVVAKATIPSSKMPGYIPGIQTGLEIGVNALFKPNEPTIVNNPSVTLQKFVAYMSVPTLIGDEVATNADVIKSFAEFTGDITRNVAFFLTIPKFLHPYVLPYLQNVRKHNLIMEKHIGPVIRQRREKMRLAKEAGEDHGLESNFLQGLIEYTKKDNNGVQSTYTEKELCHAVLLIAFASVHTTSMNLSFCIYWLIARPDLKQRLIDEIEQVAPGNTPITAEILGKMKFLNNFIREVLRQGADKLANGKKAMRDYTFYNGYQVAKGSIVETTLRQVNFGDNITRSAVKDMDPDMSLNKISTTPAKDFVTFGMGKHLCPGRFFAVQEIEMSLVYLLKKFDINTVSDPLIFIPKNM